MKQKANKNQKDTVFRRIFHNKERLLELYNAINHTNYDNPDDLTIKTLHGKTGSPSFVALSPSFIDF